MQWSDLRHGDRVHHFEYGAGTVNSAGPLWLLITWDDPAEHVDYHWSGEIDRHLTRLTPQAEEAHGQ
ncbi:hypothetical protein [Kribbella shirazensis]|uniref:Uncharacterized protein n=1 Tax=Kribbella shirazensis TaxID=1105143 RepID=A0A7X5VHI7_9ACTN|nr:hypothetical protein [Kribbella shirazensis]NIK61302.1 hypothetical protein [Kribbella shirazensis]